MRRTGFLLVLAGLVAAALLAGCRKEEQGRILSYDKGTYLGRSEAGLSEGTRVELRQRVRRQGGSQSIAALGGAPAATGDVRPPVALGGPGADQARDAARSRVLKQGLN